MELRAVSVATTTRNLKDSNTLPINSAPKNIISSIPLFKKITQRAYPAGAVTHPEPPPRDAVAPLVQESWPPPEM